MCPGVFGASSGGATWVRGNGGPGVGFIGVGSPGHGGTVAEEVMTPGIRNLRTQGLVKQAAVHTDRVSTPGPNGADRGHFPLAGAGGRAGTNPTAATSRSCRPRTGGHCGPLVCGPDASTRHHLRHARRRLLRVDRAWPYKDAFITCWDRLQATPAATTTEEPRPAGFPIPNRQGEGS